MRSIVVTALQQGNNFVRCFTANCVVSLLDHSFAKSFENARRLLTSMQSGTRLLQTLCTHSKIVSYCLFVFVNTFRKLEIFD